MLQNMLNVRQLKKSIMRKGKNTKNAEIIEQSFCKTYNNCKNTKKDFGQHFFLNVKLQNIQTNTFKTQNIG